MGILSLVVMKEDHLISGSDDCTIKIWDWNKETQVTSFDDNPSWIQALIYMEDKNMQILKIKSNFLV